MDGKCKRSVQRTGEIRLSKAACKYLLCGSDNAAADPAMMGLAQAVVDGVIETTKVLDTLFYAGAALLDQAASAAATAKAGLKVNADAGMAEAFG